MMPQEQLIDVGFKVTSVILVSLLSYCTIRDAIHPQKRLKRASFPSDLLSWKKCLITGTHRQHWKALMPVLRLHGLNLWKSFEMAYEPQDGGLPQSNNYLFLRKISLPATLNDHAVYSAISHPARSDDSRDFMLRIMTIGGQGHKHLQIMRQLSARPDIYLNNNHVLPMFKEIVFEDITIGVFPRIKSSLSSSIRRCHKGSKEKNSMEDVLYMILQALEGIAFIHSKRIAHCDLFLDNFVVEWDPISLSAENIWPLPRVYIIDFETAVQFPEDSLPSDRFIVGFPVPENIYNRPKAPELSNTIPYCPFWLDIWQFATMINDYFYAGYPEVDNLVQEMLATNPEERPTADKAMERLNNFLLLWVPRDPEGLQVLQFS